VEDTERALAQDETLRKEWVSLDNIHNKVRMV